MIASIWHYLPTVLIALAIWAVLLIVPLSLAAAAKRGDRLVGMGPADPMGRFIWEEDDIERKEEDDEG